ncbi:hypothetical protein EVAR_24636_1 [Eumeta japonica]|uniref:Uncharacterized protein n=1 Tax=Eumeta variegata TaxID=151549 RepID=A0A4C1V2F2_EUMVA|nr:hypothetical protein EVAR_24636_1 [Eumeta japonica]
MTSYPITSRNFNLPPTPSNRVWLLLLSILALGTVLDFNPGHTLKSNPRPVLNFDSCPVFDFGPEPGSQSCYLFRRAINANTTHDPNFKEARSSTTHQKAETDDTATGATDAI